MTTSDPTPITDDTRDDQAPATTPEPLTLEEARAQFDVIVAALRELGRELKADMAAKEAA